MSHYFPIWLTYIGASLLVSDIILSLHTKCCFFTPSFFQVKKVVKTTTTRTVIPSVSDTLSLDGGGSVTGMSACTGPVYRQAQPAGPMDYPTHTVPRNYQYGPPAGYEDYRTGPPSEAYTSLSRGARMDDRYRYSLLLKAIKRI